MLEISKNNPHSISEIYAINCGQSIYLQKVFKGRVEFLKL